MPRLECVESEAWSWQISFCIGVAVRDVYGGPKLQITLSTYDDDLVSYSSTVTI